jgi:hypothetical protein
LDAGNDETLGRLSWPAFKKRQEVAGSWALAGSEPYGDFDISADLVCGREADTPSASVGIGREAATRIAERFHNFRVSA